jgi:hypothetical protein
VVSGNGFKIARPLSISCLIIYAGIEKVLRRLNEKKPGDEPGFSCRFVAPF